MNERIRALLLRLAEDAALRARFVEDGRTVMEEAGLTPLERGELGRHVDAKGHPHPHSIVPSDEVVDVPEEPDARPSMGV